jgi:hypothetical protein
MSLAGRREAASGSRVNRPPGPDPKAGRQVSATPLKAAGAQAGEQNSVCIRGMEFYFILVYRILLIHFLVSL